MITPLDPSLRLKGLALSGYYTSQRGEDDLNCLSLSFLWGKVD